MQFRIDIFSWCITPLIRKYSNNLYRRWYLPFCSEYKTSSKWYIVADIFGIQFHILSCLSVSLFDLLGHFQKGVLRPWCQNMIFSNTKFRLTCKIWDLYLQNQVSYVNFLFVKVMQNFKFTKWKFRFPCEIWVLYLQNQVCYVDFSFVKVMRNLNFEIFLKSWILAQILRFLADFWQVTPIYIKQKMVYSNFGSEMTPFFIS